MTANEYHNKQMENPEYRKAYEKLQPEIEIMRVLIYARETQRLSLKQLSECTGITQADLTKLENGTHNPPLKQLQHLADGLNMTLRLEFVPKGDMPAPKAMPKKAVPKREFLTDPVFLDDDLPL